VRWIEHVLEAALERQPAPLPEEADSAAAVPPAAAADEKPALIKH
jgi:ATP-dependent Lon protease